MHLSQSVILTIAALGPILHGVNHVSSPKSTLRDTLHWLGTSAQNAEDSLETSDCVCEAKHLSS